VRLTEEQRRAVEARGGVVVVAGAGTGKTRTLVHRYLELIDRGLTPLQLVAVTFTEAAAAELRGRLRGALGEARPELLPELEAAPIGTLHALAARICREHPRAAGVPADFRVLDEVEAALWLREHLPRAIATLPTEIYEALPASFLKKALEALLADPLAAREAFERGPEAMRSALDGVVEDLLEEARQHLAYLRTSEASGKLEELRGLILAAWEEGRDAFLALASAVRLPGGRTRHQEVKERIKAVKALAERAALLRLTPEHERAWAALKRAFHQVYERLEAERFAGRVLDFAGLEVHALRALEDPAVRAYYRQRWRHALVDEHQDTNPVQGRLLERLFGSERLTLVGDPKQSIYGFRRADPRVFARALDGAPERVALSRSFRAHRELVEAVNRVFDGLLEGHAPLTSDREPPHPGPHLEAFVVRTEAPSAARRWAEAREVARRVRRWVEEGLPVWDREAGEVRPARWSDFAVLARAWSVLEGVALALLAEGVPAVLSRGEGLLESREAKDGLALLRFLADPGDDLALVAVLRSPLFAVSDRVLQVHAGGEGPWWRRAQATADPALTRAREVLEELLRLRRREPPSRLLQLADRRTGYTAVLANLPLAERRLADWSGFLELVRGLERGNEDAFTVVRRLRELVAAGVRVERPPLAAGDAVSLMTVHAAKGLEWPVVFLVGLDHRPNRRTPPVRFDPEVGVGLSPGDEDERDGLFHLLDARRREAEAAELRRLLYVGMTRAADRLVVSAAKEAEAFKLLKDRLPEVEGLEPQADDLLPPFPDPPAPAEPGHVLLGAVGSALDALPVTALDDYRLCPRRFYLAHIAGHPGAGDEVALARRVGLVVHEALARGLPHDAERLAVLDPGLSVEALAEAADLVRRFREEEAYARFRAEAEAWEVGLDLELEGLRLAGRADLVGPTWVLDFKTDTEVRPEDHLLQLWAYARGLGKTEAFLAYLRHGRVVRVALQGLEEEARRVARAIRSGVFDPSPSPEVCVACPYRHAELCPEGIHEIGMRNRS